MTDIFTKAKRSDVMSRIRSHGNKTTEMALMRLFRRHKIVGWRRHAVVGLTRSSKDSTRRRQFTRCKPDFIFRDCRLAIFVDGCFWHGCPRHAAKPKSNAEFWRTKLTANVARDRQVTTSLRRGRWRVLRIWEHQLVNESQVMTRVRRCLAQGPLTRPLAPVHQ